jgi:carboxyl-terminal processing protease
LNGIILDLRGNPGGLLDAAVQVVSKFVPKGSLIVSTRGRRPDADKSYHSSELPAVPETPMIVLTNRESASASEIVSGALQDLDRALIVGDRTFGKGLVQTILPLSYGAQLKVTTARYYVPSGRSIQEVDYRSKGQEGLFAEVGDTTAKEFRTAGGRQVFEHGGIMPDSVVTAGPEGPMIEALKQKSLFFRYVNTYAGRVKELLTADVTPEVLAGFKTFLETQGFDFQEETEKTIIELRASSEELHYGEEVMADLDRISDALQREKERAFERYKDHITHYLSVELHARLEGEEGRIRASLESDVQLETAVRLLRDKTAFEKKIRG